MDGESITNAIISMMGEVCGDGRWQDKLVACATDGESVMRGKWRGVVSRWVLGIYCMAHCLELALKASVKNCSMANEREDLLSNLHVFLAQKCSE